MFMGAEARAPPPPTTTRAAAAADDGRIRTEMTRFDAAPESLSFHFSLGTHFSLGLRRRERLMVIAW